jgi:hypothetical protein
MALQGNLRDFSATEILQLLGSQKKTGCLIIESGAMRAVVFVHDGRIVSTRASGMVKDDPLVLFLRRINRLTDEQVLGLTTIHHESRRDLEDLLVNGRYMEQQDLSMFVERQILDTLMTIMGWPDGAYRFDPNDRWEAPALARLSMDGVLIEIARRIDEQKRYAKVFHDPNLLLSVRDLPDPEEPLSEEESDLLGLVDGRRTVAEVIEAAPLSGFEALDALNRFLGPDGSSSRAGAKAVRCRARSSRARRSGLAAAAASARCCARRWWRSRSRARCSPCGTGPSSWRRPWPAPPPRTCSPPPRCAICASRSSSTGGTRASTRSASPSSWTIAGSARTRPASRATSSTTVRCAPAPTTGWNWCRTARPGRRPRAARIPSHR